MKLSFLKSRRLWAAALPVSLALAVACGGVATSTPDSPTATSEPPTAAPTGVVEQPTVIVDEATPPSIVDDSTPTSFEPPTQDAPPVPQVSDGLPESQALDANEVVAAYEEVLGAIYDNLLPSVVHIQVVIQQGGAFGGTVARAEGSGFLWSEEGHIVTNHHVVNGASEVTVIFADGTELDAEILGKDPDSDLAVLKVDLPSGNRPAVHLGDSDEVRPGQLAVAIGNPFGQEFTLTSGIVSAIGRTIRSGNTPFSIPEAIQTDAAINPGNSGGPLLDRLGRVIGINTQILTESGSNSGVGFAVPINIAKQVVPVLIEEGEFEYSFLGITGTTVTRNIRQAMNLPDDVRGTLVINVTGGGPSDKASLRASGNTRVIDGVSVPVGGDIITAVDGESVRNMDDIITYLSKNTRPGDVVTFNVLRNGQQIKVDVVLGTRPS